MDLTDERSLWLLKFSSYLFLSKFSSCLNILSLKFLCVFSALQVHRFVALWAFAYCKYDLFDHVNPENSQLGSHPSIFVLSVSIHRFQSWKLEYADMQANATCGMEVTWDLAETTPKRSDIMMYAAEELGSEAGPQRVMSKARREWSTASAPTTV